MCGPAKEPEMVLNQSARCCSSKVEACVTGEPDISTLTDKNNDDNQEIKDSCGQVLIPDDCCASKNKVIKPSEETDKGCESSVSKDDCRDGCCDDEITMDEDEGCEDGCCSMDDTFEKDEGMEDGCCPSSLQQETAEEDTSCKSACCGPVVVKPIEVVCGTDKKTDQTEQTVIIASGSSSGCCSSQNKGDTICASTKNSSKSCAVPDEAAVKAPIPKTGCCSKVPLLNTEKPSCCSSITREEPSGCCPTVPQVIQSPKKGCRGPKSITSESPLQEGKTSGCCSTTQPSKNDNGACDTKSSDADSRCSPAKDEVVCSTKACCTGDSPVQSEKGCCSKGSRKGKSEQASKSKSSKSKSRAASLGAFTLQIFISGMG